jgi:molybdopterin molybdotransferase
MIHVKEAETLIQQAINEKFKMHPVTSISTEDCPNISAIAPIQADRDYPPFNRVAMDGIAIDASSYEVGKVYPAESIQAAGNPQVTLRDRNACIEVMTGGVLPIGTDAVVPYERTQRTDAGFVIEAEFEIHPYKNVHTQGADAKAEDDLILSHTRMNGPQWAVAASVGAGALPQYQQPKILFINTGSELVPIDQQPESHQIRMSNIYGVKAALQNAGFTDFTAVHLKDDPDQIRQACESYLEAYDLIILSGGVSAGKFDYVPSTFKSLGVEQVFHKISQKPGKPMWFGKHANCLVFGLPGNPMSALVCLSRYILPSLASVFSHPKPLVTHAVLDEEIQFNKDMTLFAPVRLSQNAQGQLLAIPVAHQGSGDFIGLAKSDGFLELPAKRHVYEAHEVHRLYLW